MLRFFRYLAMGSAIAMAMLPIAQAQTARIPETRGTSFAGAQVALPGDLHGRIAILVLGFSKASGDVCSGWGKRLTTSYNNSSVVTYYQLPMLEGVPKLIRGMVLKSMRSDVPETEQAHFVPIFSGKDDWQKLAHYANTDDAYIFVIDSEGRVHWQTSGKVTDAGFNALKAQVDALQGRR